MAELSQSTALESRVEALTSLVEFILDTVEEKLGIEPPAELNEALVSAFPSPTTAKLDDATTRLRYVSDAIQEVITKALDGKGDDAAELKDTLELVASLVEDFAMLLKI